MATILSIHDGAHDSAAALFDDYRIVAAVQKERLSRHKKDGGPPLDCVAEVLAIARAARRDIDAVVFSRSQFMRRLYRSDPLRTLRSAVQGVRDQPRYLHVAMAKAATDDPGTVLDTRRVLDAYDLPPRAAVFFSNHHLAHALPSLFFTEWDSALLYTADAAGDNVNTSTRVFRDGALACRFGDDALLHRPYRCDSVARAYQYVTAAIGFRPVHHEGKVTGLAAHGQPVLHDAFIRPFRVDDDGVVHSTFTDDAAFRAHFVDLCRGQSREDCAASIQQFAETLIVQSVQRVLAREKLDRLGLAGGLFANVKLNQRLVEACGLAGIFVVPPMGDDGLVIGGALQYLLERDGLAAWLKQRRRLADVYWGRSYDDAGARFCRADPAIRPVPGDPAETAAQLMAEGHIVALFSQRMEYGPRALGARSIMASPERRDINDTLNRRLDRSEFMPFAPVIAAADARAVFAIDDATDHACRFMTITCATRREWRERLPAIVHVDGTARPQIIERAVNPLYFDILAAFKRRTGLPAAINTSFNVHEEPIIDTPQQAARALLDNRVDYLATATGLYGVAGRD